MQGNFHAQTVHAAPKHTPCIFEHVYFARPDSIMDGVSVYEARLNMGEKLAEKILRQFGDDHEIDGTYDCSVCCLVMYYFVHRLTNYIIPLSFYHSVVIPVPDTSRTSALQAAYRLDRPFREGFMKNRYIGRTFIMPGQATRKKSVRLKLNTIRREFEGKNVLLVDDSIVRGTTANEIVQMTRDAGAKKVFFCSAAPPIRYPNIYGIDLPSQQELIAFGRTEEEIAAKIGCEWVVYQDQADLEESVRMAVPKNASRDLFQGFDCSTFDGIYVTGQRMGDEYFAKLHSLRNDAAKATRDGTMSVPAPTAIAVNSIQKMSKRYDAGTDSDTASNTSRASSSCSMDGLSNPKVLPQEEKRHSMRVLEDRRAVPISTV